jgi:hypothetical protein
MAKDKPSEMAKDKPSPLVKMTRPEPQFKGGPITADVHSAEVANFTAGGWQIAKETAK